ncbi:tRNA pseudouridine(38-40) synthase TruA [Falsibacillus pallidus]|uniref:tRNA pseudouridine synthase A n=1 Tax=Falsibacillus pallidus TaxID=493781 RepID=A0A370G7C2_9BACI|nr:tRNA pseudouridine(38-40) synthase TruA [Falsibacillus pallidus]RDI38976.1 tRNA pseudouridine38-40 synthase [Falsibacillus pallidus]
MQRYKCIIAYDGTNFSGYQIQPEGRTVQGELEKALGKLHKQQAVKVTGSGRTDAGVHAKGQVIHFDSPLNIPEDRWVKALNSMLPDDAGILSVEKASPDFHARFSAVGKEYRYKISLGRTKDPFNRNYVCPFPFALDWKAMEEAASHLIGTHDFTSFCSAKSEVEDKVRTIHSIKLFESGEDEITFQFIGNGFLYNMVRILTGTILEAGSGKINPNDLPKILNSKNRDMAGKTAPAKGLYLWKVFYDN